MAEKFKKVGKQLIKNTHIHLGIRANLNDAGIVKTLPGIASIISLGCGLGYLASGGNKPRPYVASAVGTVCFGLMYLKLNEKKQEDILIPRSSTIPLPEDELPNYLQRIGNGQPTRHSLNEIAHALGVDLTQLVGAYLYAGDIAIFFSIANTGKTIMGIQSSIDMAEGQCSLIPMETLPPVQEVHYFLFEMNQAQIRKRLRPKNEGEQVINFPSNVIIHDSKGCFNYVDDFLKHIALMAETEMTKDTVIIIDTITDLCPNFFSKEVSHVINAMRNIQANALTKKRITITFLIEAHAKKHHDWDVLELESLKGSVNQANLADSVFALGLTADKSVRYLKLLKDRNDEKPNTVDLIKIKTSPYLHFDYYGTGSEGDVLPEKPGRNKQSQNQPFNKPCPTAHEKNGPYERLTPEDRDLLYKLKNEGMGGDNILSQPQFRGKLDHRIQIDRVIKQMVKKDGYPPIVKTKSSSSKK